MKIKPLTKEQIIISTDRLTRFKNTETKYLRVFKDIVLHNLLSPNFNKNELDDMDYEVLRNYAQEIFNSSLKKYTDLQPDYSINKKLAQYEESVFKIDSNTKKLLDNKLNYRACLELIKDTKVQNLLWLNALSQENSNIKIQRGELSFRFPIETVIIAEGATEETLLPEFAKLCGYDFDKNGVYIIPAGGKNQVVKLFYQLSEDLKLPIFVLLDKDGAVNAKEIEPKLRKTDKIHIIECGEFEDLLSQNLVDKTLNYELQNISEMNTLTPKIEGHRVEYLEEVFKTRGLHEFKKVEFSQMIKNNISGAEDVTPEIKLIIDEIKSLKIPETK